MIHILCATDLLAKSDAAVDRTGLLAQSLDARTSLLHVVAPMSSERVLEQTLQIAIASMKSRARPPLWRHGPMPEVAVRAGNPARVILNTISQGDIDLLVLGPHRKRGVLDALEGTIAEKVLGARRAPLLMVQNDASVAYQRVLLALDLSAESASALRVAERLLMNDDTQATIVHANEPPYQGMLRATGATVTQIVSYADYYRREAAGTIRELLERESRDSHRYEVVIAENHPVSAIVRAVEIHRPDVLVLGTSGGGPVRRALLGSVANQLLRTVTCDVLIVPRG
jgi:universal stress protein E